MSAVFKLLTDARAVLGHRCLMGELRAYRAVIAAVFIVLGANAAFGVTGALVSDGAPAGLHPSGFDPTFAGEN